ncbi:alpha/beta fold hydrolase [uncultured Roseobacter sp.]|uniref:alpha/beta hydrolase n=1 Tax=uncultured Roseobacter sp. TaxID=114847 RepID=UPI0026354EA2|nr:alpha/beta fold hydrolase [uncultured Roseobacter sp.]
MNWQRHDTAQSFFIASSNEPCLRLHLRAHAPDAQRTPVLFVHGATYASRLYDIPHPGASWIQATAGAGFAAYALDIRGYGQSRPDTMARSDASYARASEAIRDIDDAIGWICARHGVSALGLVGGSWGTVTTALYASTIGAKRVNRLGLYAPIYAEHNDGWHKILADPEEPSRFNPGFGAARLVTEESTRARWDAEIPEGAGWRDEAVFQALVQSSLADDPQAQSENPPAFRAPNGTLVDLWEAFNARPVYDPARITCPTILIRGGADPTSTRSDALRLLGDLGTVDKQYIEIANGAHFVSAERRAPEVFSHMNRFLCDRSAGCLTSGPLGPDRSVY